MSDASVKTADSPAFRCIGGYGACGELHGRLRLGTCFCHLPQSSIERPVALDLADQLPPIDEV
jgi:hypothetical protein